MRVLLMIGLKRVVIFTMKNLHFFRMKNYPNYEKKTAGRKITVQKRKENVLFSINLFRKNYYNKNTGTNLDNSPIIVAIFLFVEGK